MKNVDFRPGNMIQKTRNCDQRQGECKSLKYSIIIRNSLVFSEETIVWHKNVQHCHNSAVTWESTDVPNKEAPVF